MSRRIPGGRRAGGDPPARVHPEGTGSGGDSPGVQMMDHDEAMGLLLGGAEGIALWNRRRSTGEIIPDLVGVDLRKTVLSNANLVEARLHKADLSGARLGNADLHGARLHKADLSGTYL